MKRLLTLVFNCVIPLIIWIIFALNIKLNKNQNSHLKISDRVDNRHREAPTPWTLRDVVRSKCEAWTNFLQRGLTNFLGLFRPILKDCFDKIGFWFKTSTYVAAQWAWTSVAWTAQCLHSRWWTTTCWRLTTLQEKPSSLCPVSPASTAPAVLTTSTDSSS